MQRALAHIDALFAAVKQQPDVPPAVLDAFTAIRNIDPYLPVPVKMACFQELLAPVLRWLQTQGRA
ncbi:MAG: hypothetical protein JO001_28530 [Alphaproteobacteria bacterium]|nr:hypothetical protein [Alphaproteobacteria bacterium]